MSFEVDGRVYSTFLYVGVVGLGVQVFNDRRSDPLPAEWSSWEPSCLCASGLSPAFRGLTK
jgi:hypothetical protein